MCNQSTHQHQRERHGKCLRIWRELMFANKSKTRNSQTLIPRKHKVSYSKSIRGLNTHQDFAQHSRGRSIHRRPAEQAEADQQVVAGVQEQK